MKKLLTIAALAASLMSVQAQYLYTNFTQSVAGTNVLTTARWMIAEITTQTGTGAAVVNIFDADNTNGTAILPAAVGVTGYAYTNETWFTNAKSLLVTNVDIGYTYTNLTIAASTNVYQIYSVSQAASTTVTRTVNLITMRGLAVGANSNVTYTIKYRPWGVGL